MLFFVFHLVSVSCALHFNSLDKAISAVPYAQPIVEYWSLLLLYKDIDITGKLGQSWNLIDNLNYKGETNPIYDQGTHKVASQTNSIVHGEIFEGSGKSPTPVNYIEEISSTCQGEHSSSSTITE